MKVQQRGKLIPFFARRSTCSSCSGCSLVCFSLFLRRLLPKLVSKGTIRTWAAPSDLESRHRVFSELESDKGLEYEMDRVSYPSGL